MLIMKILAYVGAFCISMAVAMLFGATLGWLDAQFGPPRS